MKIDRKLWLQRSLLLFWFVAVDCIKLPPEELTDFQSEVGNDCPESSPWPCRTPTVCLSFDFICDGTPDCPDGYDEDKGMCTAKSRPPKEYLEGFIQRYRHWLIPDFLGDGSPSDIATKLVESPTIKEFAKAADLTDEQYQNFNNFMTGVSDDKEMHLLLLRMPVGAWRELHYLFKRIAKSGFFDANRNLD